MIPGTNISSRIDSLETGRPFAEVLVEGELSPFEHEAPCLLELPPSTNGGLRVRVSSAFSHLQGFIATEGFPTPAHGRPHLSLTRFAVVFQKAYRASKI